MMLGAIEKIRRAARNHWGNGGQIDNAKIAACFNEARDPNSMDPGEKIRRAAGQSPEQATRMTKSDISAPAQELLPKLSRELVRPAVTTRNRMPNSAIAAARQTISMPPPRIDRSPSRELPAVPKDHPLAYWEFRDKLAAAIRAGKVQPTINGLASYAGAARGLDAYEAVDWTERFLRGLQRDLHRKRVSCVRA